LVENSELNELGESFEEGYRNGDLGYASNKWTCIETNHNATCIYSTLSILGVFSCTVW